MEDGNERAVMTRLPSRGGSGGRRRTAIVCGFALALPLGFPLAVEGQSAADFLVGEARTIPGARPDARFFEPRVAVEPANDDRLIVGVVEMPNDSSTLVVTFESLDGGDSWIRRELPGLRDALGSIDPWVTFGTDGVAYLSALVQVGPPVGMVIPLETWVYAFDDATGWSAPRRIGRGSGGSFDQPKIARGLAGPSLRPTTVVVGEKWGPRPGDQRRPSTIGTAVGAAGEWRLHHLSADRRQKAPAVPVILPDGSIHVAYNAYLSEGRWLGRVELTSSFDGGVEWSSPSLVTEGLRPGLMELLDDPSDQDGATLHLVHRVSGGLAVMTSRDRGSTWGQPQLVTGADEGPPPAIGAASDPKGGIGILQSAGWRRGDRLCNRVLFSYLSRGADRPHPPLELTDGDSCVSTDASLRTQTMMGELEPAITARWVRGGEYVGIAAFSSGDFFVVWTEHGETPMRLKGARLMAR